ncbi:MAG: hypothetical protein IAE98_01335 [Candidatus Kapabacteria bacterium]|nr:hypothetical protein [Candidatus Kapabacteria bacterium]
MLLECNYEALNKNYKEFINVSKNFCDYFMFVVRRDVTELNTQEISNVIELFKKFLVNTTETDEWPGTKLINDTATVYLFALNDESAILLNHIAMNFDDWIHPSFPEDLCFLRTSSDEFLTTIIHERDAYFILSEAEHHLIQNLFPDIFN